MRSHVSATARRVGQAVLAGVALTTLGSCVEPRAITASGIEVPALGSTRERRADPALDFIREVRLGHGLDMNGKVPPGFGASSFAVGDPIHLSMWNVTDAPAGSVVRVRVRDAADRIVWSEDRKVAHGGSYLSFGIGRTLVRGTYRADVSVGYEVRSRTGFEVFEWKDRSTLARADAL